MDCQGVWASGTSFIEFDDVRVPVENLLGKENKGFPLIMSNFSPERVGIAIQANRFARVCLEESMKYASKRKTFGVLLRDHPVIRAKMAVMASRIESTHAWIESGEWPARWSAAGWVGDLFNVSFDAYLLPKLNSCLPINQARSRHTVTSRRRSRRSAQSTRCRHLCFL